MEQAQFHPGQPTGNSRAKADELRKSGQFAAAADIYRSIWPDNDPWTGWAFALCLRKLKNTDEALNVAQALFELAPRVRARPFRLRMGVVRHTPWSG